MCTSIYSLPQHLHMHLYDLGRCILFARMLTLLLPHSELQPQLQPNAKAVLCPHKLYVI
jgi:hypothetical protein